MISSTTITQNSIISLPVEKDLIEKTNDSLSLVHEYDSNSYLQKILNYISLAIGLSMIVIAIIDVQKTSNPGSFIHTFTKISQSLFSLIIIGLGVWNYLLCLSNSNFNNQLNENSPIIEKSIKQINQLISSSEEIKNNINTLKSQQDASNISYKTAEKNLINARIKYENFLNGSPFVSNSESLGSNGTILPKLNISENNLVSIIQQTWTLFNSLNINAANISQFNTDFTNAFSSLSFFLQNKKVTANDLNNVLFLLYKKNNNQTILSVSDFSQQQNLYFNSVNTLLNQAQQYGINTTPAPSSGAAILIANNKDVLSFYGHIVYFITSLGRYVDPMTFENSNTLANNIAQSASALDPTIKVSSNSVIETTNDVISTTAGIISMLSNLVKVFQQNKQNITNGNTIIDILNNLSNTTNQILQIINPINGAQTINDFPDTLILLKNILTGLKINTGTNNNIQTDIINLTTAFNSISTLNVVGDVSAILKQINQYLTNNNITVLSVPTDSTIAKSNNVFNTFIPYYNNCVSILNNINALNGNKSTQATLVNDVNAILNQIGQLPTFKSGNNSILTILNNYKIIINSLNNQLNTFNIVTINDNGNSTLSNTNKLYSNYNTIVTQTNKLDSSLNASNFNLSTFSTAINTLNTTLIANNYTSALNTYTINKYITPKSNLITYLQTVSKNTNNNTYVNDAIAICNSILTLPTFNNNVASAYSVILGKLKSLFTASATQLNTFSIASVNDNATTLASNVNTLISNYNTLVTALNKLDSSLEVSSFNLSSFITATNTLVSTLTADGYSSALNTYFTNYINANQQLLTALQKISSGSTSLTDFNLVCDAITALSTFNNSATKAYEIILGNLNNIISTGNSAFITLNSPLINNNLLSFNTTLNTYITNDTNIRAAIYSMDQSIGTSPNNFIGITTTMNTAPYITYINTLNDALLFQGFIKTGNTSLNTFLNTLGITPIQPILNLCNKIDTSCPATLSGVTEWATNLVNLLSGKTFLRNTQYNSWNLSNDSGKSIFMNSSYVFYDSITNNVWNGPTDLLYNGSNLIDTLKKMAAVAWVSSRIFGMNQNYLCLGETDNVWSNILYGMYNGQINYYGYLSFVNALSGKGYSINETSGWSQWMRSHLRFS